MPSYYIYLISSLPMLHFGATPPFSSEEFLKKCEGMISAEDIKLIKQALQGRSYDYAGDNPTMRRFRNFEIALRNELVRIRSSRKHIDPSKYLREDGEPDISINHAAINAYRAQSLFDSEKILDQARWHVLDSLAFGHYFDIDRLIIYAYMLSILEKWAGITAASKPQTIQAVFEKG